MVRRRLSAGHFKDLPRDFSGLLFATGVLLSNWRHSMLAIFGAIIGIVVAYYFRGVDPAIADLGVQTLTAPFVFTTWLMLDLGWIEDNWFDVKNGTASVAGSGSDTAASAQALKGQSGD